MTRFFTLLLLSTLSLPATALDVFACEPEWAALARELGGEHVQVFSATTAMQDPHRIQARPSLIARLRRADLLVCTGAELEAGWLPLLLRRAANPKVLPGRPGHFAAADHVPLRDVPTVVDRSQGDIHPAGNPHIHTDPRNVLRVASALGERLAALDPSRAADYRTRLEDFQRRWADAIARWERRAAPLEGMRVVTQHRSWIYLVDWLGLEEVATLEPKPGLPPSGAHLAEVVARLQERPAAMVLRAAYQDPQPSQWLAQRAAVRPVVLPYTVGADASVPDLFALFDQTVDRLLEGAP